MGFVLHIISIEPNQEIIYWLRISPCSLLYVHFIYVAFVGMVDSAV